MSAIEPLVWDCGLHDVPWLLETARTSYAGLVDGWDDAGTEKWINACILHPHTIVVRSHNVAAFALIEIAPWAPGERYCDLMHLFGRAARPMETFQVVREIDRRRRMVGVKRFYIGSEFADLGPIGRRLGGRALPAAYVIED